MSSEHIDISGMDRAEVLAALYNASKPLGSWPLRFVPQDMTTVEARELLGVAAFFDYLKGRVMKVDLSTDSLDPWLYDRDNGPGAALRALAPLAAKKGTGNA